VREAADDLPEQDGGVVTDHHGDDESSVSA
jgi:hypothetical protein